MRRKHHALLAVSLLLVAGMVDTGCAHNPFKTAVTQEQKLFAVHGAWTESLKTAADYVVRPDADPDVKNVIKKIEVESAQADKAFQAAVVSYKDGNLTWNSLLASLKALNPYIQQMPGRFIKAEIKTDSHELTVEVAP